MTDPDTTPTDREPVRFLVFSASLRTGSINARLAALAASAIESNGGLIDHRAMSDFDCPSYNQDVQDGDGFPAGAERLRDCVQASDAFVISSPEYNASMPGVLKNAIDWVSRFRPQPFNPRVTGQDLPGACGPARLASECCWLTPKADRRS